MILRYLYGADGRLIEWKDYGEPSLDATLACRKHAPREHVEECLLEPTVLRDRDQRFTYNYSTLRWNIDVSPFVFLDRLKENDLIWR